MDDLEKFRQHSILLNQVAWKISKALGDIPEGVDKHWVEDGADGTPGVLMDLDRLIAKANK
jgi:hypothetical protein